VIDPPPTGPEARITSLGEPGRPGPVLSRRSIWTATAVATTPLHVMSLVVFVAGIAFTNLAAPFLGPIAVLATLIGWVSWLALMIGYAACYNNYLPCLLFYRRSRKAVAARPDALVDPEDPETIYIQVIPRRNWGRPMLENASETGFRRINEAAGRLVYEGDAERWVIPAAAIRSLEMEVFGVGPFQRFGLDVTPILVLKAAVGGRLWEAPISPRHIFFRPRRLRDRWGEVHWLRRQIERLFSNEE
jgi:hypothetical protein